MSLSFDENPPQTEPMTDSVRADLRPLRVTAFNASVGRLVSGEGPSAGGSELDLWNTARALAKSPGVEVRLLTCRAWSTGAAEQTVDQVRLIGIMPPRPCSTHRVLAARLFMVFYYLRLFLRLLAVPADVFYAKLASVEVLLVYAAARWRRLPVCFRVSHDFEVQPALLEDKIFRGNRWLCRLFLHVLRNMSAVVCQTATQATKIRNLGIADPVVIPNAHEIETVERWPSAGERSLVLWVGRCYPSKRPMAFVALARGLPSRKFVLVLARTDYPGSDTLMTEVMAASADLKNLTLIPGAGRDDLTRLYLQARVFVLTSEAEGFPNVVIEAFKYGVPVVSDTLDLDRLLTPVPAAGQVGRLDAARGYCVSGDAEAMAAVIERLCTDHAWWTECSNQARSYAVATYDAAQIAVRYEDLFRRLASAQGTSC
jgi:glycosyltransferase involved in cell wall biosynthesis